jgi:hypothetical protein
MGRDLGRVAHMFRAGSPLQLFALNSPQSSAKMKSEVRFLHGRDTTPQNADDARTGNFTESV